jgi:arylsulfatase A-like enzyme
MKTLSPQLILPECFAQTLSRTRKKFVTCCALAASSVFAWAAESNVAPNILLIYADDIGYGDFSCYGAKAVQTPNVDRLAKEGLRFTSAYSASATCTPSRYSMLTGEYAFRQKGTGVLPGDAAMIIRPGRATLPSMLQQAGYYTAVVGKWHLGLGDSSGVDWNKEIKPGPREIGFDYSFIMAATGDRVPCVYVEDGKIVGLDPSDPIKVNYREAFPGEPTGVTHRDQLKLDWSHGHNMAVVNGVGRIGYMTGGKAALWKDEDMADEFTRKAVAFLERQRKDRPFHLYFATHDIHVPRVPHARFVGKSSMGARGDAILQFDRCVGELVSTLDKLGLTKDTLVILTSDNGPVLDDGYKDGAKEQLGDHKPAGPWRGNKYSAFEGGTRVPFIVRWPGRVKHGVSDAMISQVDFPASFAALLGRKFPVNQGPDSQNLLAALLGDEKTGRDHVVEHARGLALRQGDWKYIEPGQGPARAANTNVELGNDPGGLLFNLADDPGEQKNLASQQPEKLKELAGALQKIRQAAASRP